MRMSSTMALSAAAVIIGFAASLTSAQARAQMIPPDFDGDGFDDLAVGVDGDDVGGIVSAGAVNVIYGAPAGLTATGDQHWHQNSPGILGDNEMNDFFGSSLAWGDFDGDGFTDLAVGVPNEDLLFEPDVGVVHVIYGSGSGLSATGSQVWHQDSPGIRDVSEHGDTFGSTLAVGDFNGDGFDDLAVGVYQEIFDDDLSEGAVNVIYGSPAGLTAAGNQLWYQSLASILDVGEESDGFSRSMTAGDFDGDGIADLAVGVPGEFDQSGAVSVIYGSGAGLTAVGNQLWHQNSRGILGVGEVGDIFGSSLAAGDFDGDGYMDLAIAAFLENVGNLEDAGAVYVIYGSIAGLAADGSQSWHQNSPGILDVSEAFDLFGHSLAAGDFNGDGRADLAIGVFPEDLGGVLDSGAVHLIYGATAGLTAAGDQFWHQNSSGILGDNEQNDYFGVSLASGDFNGDGFTDLTIGVILEDLLFTEDTGVVHVLNGSGTGISAAGSQVWHQDSPGILGVAHEGDEFGRLSGVNSYF